MIEAGIFKHVRQVGLKLLTLSTLLSYSTWQTLYAASSENLAQFSDDEEEVQNREDILCERHSLLEMITKDFAFVKQHPAMFMTSAQMILAMILDQGTEEVTVPGFGSVTVYNFFSRNNAVTGGRRIFGHYEGIKSIVEGIASQAKNEKSGVKVPLLVGTHGTGKTEFRDTIANGLRHQTTHNPVFQIYEIVWNVDACKKIPSLFNFLKTRQTNEMRSAMHSSPLALLPERYQQEIAKIGRPILHKQIEIDDVVIPELDPVSKDMRDKILEHFAAPTKDEFVLSVLAELKISAKTRYTDLEKVKILSKFASMKRVILGEPGTVPKIDAQGDEIDYGGIFLSENPIYRMLDDVTSPWAWNLGAIPKANRTLVFLDELLRNGPELLDPLLTTFESRTVSHGGSPAYPLDAVIIAATNTASVDHIRADKRSHAQIDRMNVIPFDWNINPYEIAQILLYMNGKQMKMKKLETASLNTDDASGEEAAYQGLDIDELFPRAKRGEPSVGPDGRYSLLCGKNEFDGVFISPHALMMMADFIAVTRISTDEKAAIEVSGGEQVIREPLFRDHITRIKALKGELSFPHSDLKAIYKLSLNLKEGSFGVSARDAGLWLSKALAEAKKEGNDRTLSPVLLRRTYERLVDTGTIQVPDQATKLKWRLLMDRVVGGELIPKLRQDIYSSFHNDGKAEDIYNEVIAEITQLSQDSKATEYEKDGHTQAINLKRLAEIQKIYQSKVGTVLSYQHIASFYLMQMTRSPGKVIRDEQLLGAIHEYITKSLDSFISIKDLLDFGEKNIGTNEVAAKYRSFEEVLKHRKGYNRRSILDALRIIKEVDEKGAKP